MTRSSLIENTGDVNYIISPTGSIPGFKKAILKTLPSGTIFFHNSLDEFSDIYMKQEIVRGKTIKMAFFKKNMKAWYNPKGNKEDFEVWVKS